MGSESESVNELVKFDVMSFWNAVGGSPRFNSIVSVSMFVPPYLPAIILFVI